MSTLPEFNKKTMVEYMMLTNKAFEHCIDTNMSGINTQFKSLKKDLKEESTNTRLVEWIGQYKEVINSANKKESTSAVDGILFLIIQHCLGYKDNISTTDYTPYKKNVIQNIIFNILKKEIINDFETFLLLGIINKITTRTNITLAHVDTLIYMLDKLFLYKFPNDKKSNGANNRGLNISKSDTLPDIYNRYVVYKKLSELVDVKYLNFNTYFELYKDRLVENAKTFPNSLPTVIPSS